MLHELFLQRLHGLVLKVQLPFVEADLPLRHELKLAQRARQLLHLIFALTELASQVHIAAPQSRHLATKVHLVPFVCCCASQGLVRGGVEQPATAPRCVRGLLVLLHGLQRCAA